MTRKEQIINAAYNEAELERQLKMHPQIFEQGFVAGAKWADAHQDIDMVVELRKKDIGEVASVYEEWHNARLQEMIEKACEWLEENAYLYCDDQDALHESALIGDFRQAMKGD